MDEIEQRILQLAETNKKPDEFINILERLPGVQSNEKGNLFLKFGIILYKYSYVALALNLWDYALKYFIKNNNEAGGSDCYSNLGLAYNSLGGFRKAIEYLEKSLEIKKRIEDKAGESICYTNLGIAYRNLGYFRKAIEYFEKSLEIKKKLGDEAGESKCYGNLGNAYINLGDFRKAFEYLEKALEIAKKIGDKAGESKCYTLLGEVYRNLGDFRKAIEYHEKSLEIAKEIGIKAVESACYTNLGLANEYLGDFRKAIEYLEKSLEIKKKIGDKAGESKCYGNLGNAYINLGDFSKAIEYHEKSLKIAKEIGDKVVESACYADLGNAYRNLGDLRKAFEYLEKALEIAKKTGDKVRESYCYTNLGNDYNSLGDFRKAIEYLEKALEIAKKIGDKVGELACYINLNNAYIGLGDFRKAIEYNEKSLEIAKKIGDKAGESKCYTNLGIAYSSLGDFSKAIEYHEKSLKIAKEIGDKVVESACYGNLGNDHYSLGDFRKAIEYHEKSLEIAKETGEIDSKRITNLNLCRIYYENKPELAYNYCKHSIELNELMGGKLVEEEYKIGLYARASDAYQYMVPLCLKLNREKEAFEYTERSKSRAFLDLLAATKIRPFVELTRELKSLLDAEENYLFKLREIQTRHLRKTSSSLGLGDVDRILDELNEIYDNIEKLDPEYVFIRKGKSISLSKIQEILSQKRNAVLVEYFITKDMMFIFVVTPQGLHIKTTRLSEEKLSRYGENYWREVVQYHGTIGDTWLDLSSYLIESISEYLSKSDLIYFVPYGLLHNIPLHALELNGEPLIKKHAVAYLPSASLIKFCKNKGSGALKSCASFGIVFKEEAENIAELFNTKAYLDVSKNKVLENIDKDILHFSCHGYFDDIDPLSSGVVLHNNEVLHAKEIFNLRLNSELVTLSACQTGLNERKPGDELIGLTRAFLYAGAPSVIVSLWSVDARSTQELMLEFYKLLKNGKDKDDKATALQEAQKRIMEKKEYSHPYYWAPFVLIGDWE